MAAKRSRGRTRTGGKHTERPLMDQLYLINYESVKLFSHGGLFALSLRSDKELV